MDEYSHSFSECCSSIESGLRWPWSAERPVEGRGGGGRRGREAASAERNTTLVIKQPHQVAHINSAEAEVTKKRLRNRVWRERSVPTVNWVSSPKSYGGCCSICQLCAAVPVLTSSSHCC